MNKFYVSIPYSVHLCSEKGWHQLDDRHTKFCVVRMHFMVRERQVDKKPKRGEILAVHEAPSGVEIKKVISIEQERSVTNTKQSIEKCLVESGCTHQFAFGLVAELKASPMFQLSPDMKSSSVESFTSSFQDSFSIENSIARKETMKFELTYTVNSEATGKYVSVVAYQKYSMDLYLAFVDYLFVDYQKSLMGLRKKRKKQPAVISQMHPNIHKHNVPLASIHYWKILPQSATVVLESEYENEVDDPDEITVKEPDSQRQYHVAMPDVPTLYQISNVAFPLKWIDREGVWTEDELRDIELEEAEGTAWWYQYRK